MTEEDETVFQCDVKALDKMRKFDFIGCFHYNFTRYFDYDI